MEKKEARRGKYSFWSLSGFRNILSLILGRRHLSKNNAAAFTLIELLVAIAIIGVLAASAFAVLNPSAQLAKAHDAQRKNDLEQIGTALDTYYNDNNRYPDNLAQIEGAYMPKLPKDPLNAQSYYYESLDGGSYRLNSKLETGSDSQIAPGACAAGYNYCITSTNTSVATYGLPIPVSPTSAPLPTSISLKNNVDACSNGSECASGNCYVDVDGDRYSPASGTKTCRASSQLEGTDCNDACATCYPGSTATTTTPDWLDQNCNGQVDELSETTAYTKTCNPITASGYQYVILSPNIGLGSMDERCRSFCAGMGTSSYSVSCYNQNPSAAGGCNMYWDTCIAWGGTCAGIGCDKNGPNSCTCNNIPSIYYR